MKKTATLLLISLFTINIYAQLPKGNSVLAWQVDMTQNNNYDSAYAYAQIGSMESIHLSFPWSSIEVFYRNVFLGFFNQNELRNKQQSTRLETNLV